MFISGLLNIVFMNDNKMCGIVSGTANNHFDSFHDKEIGLLLVVTARNNFGAFYDNKLDYC